MAEYLKIEECEEREVYRIRCRNLVIGVYRAKTKGFIGIREKFGSRYLFEEYHYDTGAPHGTTRPIEKLGVRVPDDIELREHFDYTLDSVTGKKVEFDKPVADGGLGWYFLDTGESSKEIQPVSVGNNKLFELLEPLDKAENERRN